MNIPIGKITHYFEHIGFAVIDVMNQKLCTGDTITIHMSRGVFSQVVASLKVGHRDIASVEPGDTCVVKTDQPVEPGDIIYLESRHE